MTRIYLLLIICSWSFSAASQYWQQRVEYNMVIDFDPEKHQFNGIQELTYFNNSPDTLNEVYYHMYYNAFQPGSMMDERSRNLPDPDKRIGERIKDLKENEIGYHRIDSLSQDGRVIDYKVMGSILKVTLNDALLPGKQTNLRMRFHSQVPVQIRRTGRNNIEGIDYSMSQWYPKLAEYDVHGWHATPYVAREYHGVWGDFDITIKLDSSYTIGATGRLINANEIGKGYSNKTKETNGNKLEWHFKANNVHDFVWAADRDYIHTTANTANGTILHFFYQNDTTIISNWQALPDYAVKCFNLMNELVGAYPYHEYSIIQGGDGGMEYPMATLILGNGKLPGLVSVTVHESVHSWFQGVLANNEGKYPWMDEGFNTYFNHYVMNELFNLKKENPHAGSYKSYFKLLESGNYEAISLHSDHYKTNRAYGVAAYSMGCIFLSELEYIIGSTNFERCIHRYYNSWKFKHPEPMDFKRIAEKESNIELDWYFNYFIDTYRTIDYGIESVEKNKSETKITLEKVGDFPMPIDVTVSLADGDVYYYTIPLRMMLNSKENDLNRTYTLLADWPWTNNSYEFIVPFKKKDILKIEVDDSQRLADIDRSNNTFTSKN